MHIVELFTSKPNLGQFKILKERCGHFLEESEHLPVYRNLSANTNNVAKVKVRHKEYNKEVSEAYYSAFSCNIPQRGIITSGTPRPISGNNDLFYIFPINGYQYIYNDDKDDTMDSFSSLHKSLSSQIGQRESVGILSDVLKISHKADNLSEGIANKSEILFYDISAFYAVRASYIPYDELMTILSK